jgi:flagellar hook-basal body complex protein FliE
LINPVNNSISAPLALPVSAPGKVDAAPGAASFQDLLLDAIREAGSTEKAAGQAVEATRTGGETSPAEALAAVRKADDALRMMIQIQNRMVQAYQEVQNIRV